MHDKRELETYNLTLMNIDSELPTKIIRLHDLKNQKLTPYMK